MLFSYWDVDLFACIRLSLIIMYLPFRYILFLCIFCSYVILSFQIPCLLVNHSTRPLTCVLLLPFLLLEATRSLVHLVHSSTHITTYIFLAIGFFVLYLCIVIRNEGMTNGVLMNQIIYNN